MRINDGQHLFFNSCKESFVNIGLIIEVDIVDKAYGFYKQVYSAQKIQRIKKLKEEQYQGGFLQDIFGSELGYTIDPEIGYNLNIKS